jgi:hypothetical protein
VSKLRVLHALIVGLLASLVLPACSSGLSVATYAVPHQPSLAVPKGSVLGPERQTPWFLDHVGANGETLVLRIAEGGCASYDHSVVKETKAVVTITTWNRSIGPVKPGGYACELVLFTHPYSVALRHRLGHRRLEGACAPTDDSAAGRTCSALQSAVRLKSP